MWCGRERKKHLNKNLIYVRIMVVMIIVGGVTISLVGCLNAPSIDKLFNALHKHLIFYVVCDRCVVCDSRGLRYFSFLTLLQSFEVRWTLTRLETAFVNVVVTFCCGFSVLIELVFSGLSILCMDQFTSVLARSLSYVLCSYFDSRLVPCPFFSFRTSCGSFCWAAPELSVPDL